MPTLLPLFQYLDESLCYAKYPESDSDGQVRVYCVEPALSDEKVHWHGMCTPHGYLDFRGKSWRVKALNVNMWLAYKLCKLHD
jgi:hypothetical protein